MKWTYASLRIPSVPACNGAAAVLAGESFSGDAATPRLRFDRIEVSAPIDAHGAQHLQPVILERQREIGSARQVPVPAQKQMFDQGPVEPDEIRHPAAGRFVAFDVAEVEAVHQGHRTGCIEPEAVGHPLIHPEQSDRK